MNNAHARLRIATRIHFGLLRHLGEGIDLGAMLRSEREAREVLWVCDALGDAKLAALAGEYRRCRLREAGSVQPAGRSASNRAPIAHRHADSRRSSPPSATWSPTA